MVVGTAQNETAKQFEEIQKQLTSRLGECKLTIMWDSFVKSSEFLKYTATERTKIVKTMNTTLPSAVLLGDLGYVFFTP